MLNLLISILGDTFGKVEERKIAIELKCKCELLLEISELMIWQRGNKYDPNSSEYQYLHFIRWMKSEDSNEDGDELKD